MWIIVTSARFWEENLFRCWRIQNLSLGNFVFEFSYRGDPSKSFGHMLYIKWIYDVWWAVEFFVEVQAKIRIYRNVVKCYCSKEKLWYVFHLYFWFKKNLLLVYFMCRFFIWNAWYCSMRTHVANRGCRLDGGGGCQVIIRNAWSWTMVGNVFEKSYTHCMFKASFQTHYPPWSTIRHSVL